LIDARGPRFGAEITLRQAHDFGRLACGNVAFTMRAQQSRHGKTQLGP
jgi:hypothetical protein